TGKKALLFQRFLCCAGGPAPPRLPCRHPAFGGDGPMSGIAPSGNSPSDKGWQEQESILNSFETAWQGGRRPEIDAFRPAGGGDSALLFELIQTDLEYRLKAGEAARVEEYLQRYPELGADRARLLDLLTAEYRLRRRAETDLSIAEYERRFP